MDTFEVNVVRLRKISGKKPADINPFLSILLESCGFISAEYFPKILNLTTLTFEVSDT